MEVQVTQFLPGTGRCPKGGGAETSEPNTPVGFYTIPPDPSVGFAATSPFRRGFSPYRSLITPLRAATNSNVGQNNVKIISIRVSGQRHDP